MIVPEGETDLLSEARLAFYYDRPMMIDDDLDKLNGTGPTEVAQSLFYEFYVGALCAEGPGAGVWLGWGYWTWLRVRGRLQTHIEVTLPFHVTAFNEWEDDPPEVFQRALNNWSTNTTLLGRLRKSLPQPNPDNFEGRQGRSCP